MSNQPNDPQGRPQRRKRRAQPTDNTPGERPAGNRAPQPTQTTDVGQSLTLCHRCSFFLGGYRALYGANAPLPLEEQDGWINLGWRTELRDLLERAYGMELHGDTLHYEGRCSVCARIYIFTTLPIEAESSDLPDVSDVPALLMQTVPFNR